MTPFSDDHLDRLRRSLNDDRTPAGKYLLGDVIGEGGMATVYAAEDVDLGRPVALKALKSGDNASELARRLLREARIVARLDHAAIVPVHDVGTLPDGRAYYTMKLVQGKTLAEIVGEGRPRRELLGYFIRVCEAIAFAHSRDVIHRDIKPSNIMIGEFGQILVMDWGIAKALAQPATPPAALDPEATLTHLRDDLPGQIDLAETTIDGTVMGTPAYMAPEQARGETGRVGKSSDIYALGAVLFFILTGAPPYDGEPREILARVSQGESADPRHIRKNVPRPLAAVCRKAMAQVPESRYADAQLLADDIDRFLEREPVTAYRENAFERLGRFVATNKLIVAMVVVYALSRLIIYLIARF